MSHFEKFDSYIPIDLTTISGMMISCFVISGFIIFRYFLFVTPFYFFSWPSKLRVHDQKFKPGQIRFEIFHSMISSLIFGISGYVLGLEMQLGLAKIYLRFDQYPLWYLPLSFLIFSVLHEFYFYWTHRWMHIPVFYRRIHAVHHYSVHATPWASFSFHPFEAVVQAAFLPLTVLALPIHPTVVIAYLTFMTLTAISNHSGHELIPLKWVTSWFISGEHHALHHKKFNGNFGLYFRFLDQLHGTELEEQAHLKPLVETVP